MAVTFCPGVKGTSSKSSSSSVLVKPVVLLTSDSALVCDVGGCCDCGSGCCIAVESVTVSSAECVAGMVSIAATVVGIGFENKAAASEGVLLER